MNPADFDDRKRSSPKFNARVIRTYAGLGRTGQVPNGRWPANIMHDGSDEVLAGFPAQAGYAARFFYCPKASKKDRGEANNHPTVKPTELLCYLCRLVTPPHGLILDPFMGSGSTGKAALLEGFRFVGVEREEEYVRIAAARLAGGYEPYRG